ncbi:MAG: pilus assembly FimT family protein [Trueperaceae bacterium]
MQQRGFTLIEMLVTLAILGVALTTSVSFLQMPSARLYANDLKAMIQQARFESVRRNVAVAVVWDGSAFSTYTNTGTTTSCPTGTTNRLLTHPLTEYRNVTLTTNLPQSGTARGIIWLPTGEIRGCNGLANTESTITITNKSRVSIVTVSTVGRVSVQ